MNDTLKNIYERRAVRRYKDVSVSKELIDQLIAAGCMAPSAMNRQPWKFYILTDASQIKLLSQQIAQKALKQVRRANIKEVVRMTMGFFHLSKVIDFITMDDHIFYGAPAVIFITSPLKDEWGSLDVGMCAQNIMLAAKAMGLDTCPVGFARLAMQVKDYFLLNIPASEQIELAILVGFGDEQPKAHERVGDNVFYI
jgi:nitroreductase